MLSTKNQSSFFFFVFVFLRLFAKVYIDCVLLLFDSGRRGGSSRAKTQRRGPASPRGGRSPASPRGGGGRSTIIGRSATSRGGVSPRRREDTAVQKEINSILASMNDASFILFDTDERATIDEKLRSLQKSISDCDPSFDSKLTKMSGPLRHLSAILKTENENDNNTFEVLNGINKHLTKLLNLTYYMNGFNSSNVAELPNPALGDVYSDMLGVIGGIFGVYLGDNCEDCFNIIQKDVKIILGLKEQQTSEDGSSIVSDKFKFSSNLYDNLLEIYRECKLWSVRSLRWKNYVQNWNKKNGRKMRDVIKDWQLSIKQESSMNLQFISTIFDEINKNVRQNYISDNTNWIKNSNSKNEPTQNIIVLFNNLLYIYQRLRILFINLQYVYQCILNPWSKKNIMIKNFIESNNSLIERDNGFFLTRALQLKEFGTYYITVRSSCTPLYPRLTEKYCLFLESFMNEKDYSFKGKVYKPKKFKTKYSSHATDKVFFEGKSETDDNTTDDDTTTGGGGKNASVRSTKSAKSAASDDDDNDGDENKGNNNDNNNNNNNKLPDGLLGLEEDLILWPRMSNELELMFNGKTELYIYHTERNTMDSQKKYLFAESYYHRLSWPVEICGILNEIPKIGQGFYISKQKQKSNENDNNNSNNNTENDGENILDYYYVTSRDTHGFPVGKEYGNMSCGEWDELENGMLKFENLIEREKDEERKLSNKDKLEYEWHIIPCFEKNSFVLLPRKSKGTLFLTINDTTDPKTKGKEYPIVSSNLPMKLYCAKVPEKK